MDETAALFLSIVQAAAELETEDDARRATGAVLRELAPHLDPIAAGDLARLLPDFAAWPLLDASYCGAEAGGCEFLFAVARREGLADLATAAGRIQAVFRAIAELADPAVLQSARRQLNGELRLLWASDGAQLQPQHAA